MKAWFLARLQVAAFSLIRTLAAALAGAIWFFVLRWFGIDLRLAVLIAVYQAGRTDGQACLEGRKLIDRPDED